MANRSVYFEKDSQYRFLFASHEIPRRLSAKAVTKEGQKKLNNQVKADPDEVSGISSKAIRTKAGLELKEGAEDEHTVALASNTKSRNTFFFNGKPKNSLDKHKLCFNKSCFNLAKPIDLNKFKYKELTVSLVDSEPVWRASDEYFLARGLQVPEKHSKFRYLKAPFQAPIIYTEEGIIIVSSDPPVEDDSILLLNTPLPETIDLERGEKIFLLD